MWLPGLKYYELTDAHSDIWARFVAPGKVVLSKPSSDNDVLRAAYGTSSEFLSRATNVKEGTLNFFTSKKRAWMGLFPLLRVYA